MRSAAIINANTVKAGKNIVARRQAVSITTTKIDLYSLVIFLPLLWVGWQERNPGNSLFRLGRLIPIREPQTYGSSAKKTVGIHWNLNFGINVRMASG